MTPVSPATLRVLVVEDERKVANALREGLEGEAYDVVVEGTGEGAFFRINTETFDVILLDLGLPGRDGLEILAAVRRRGLDTPVLVLTARDSLQDRVQGLDSGADDYLVKPFNFDELLARVRALLRRRQATAAPQLLRFGKLALDPAARQVTYDSQPIELSAKEFDVLELLIRHPRQVVTRETFYDRIWGYDFGGESNILEVYIRYLRAKMEKAGGGGLIQTVRGVGYRLVVPEPQ